MHIEASIMLLSIISWLRYLRGDMRSRETSRWMKEKSESQIVGNIHQPADLEFSKHQSQDREETNPRIPEDFEY